MTASDPAVEWWETDPDSPGNLERCEIEFRDPVIRYPELVVVTAFGCDSGVYTRPMFEVMSQ
ncbi:hypothetical protein DEJ49_33165 [Streptomyces venezuelae]|uniref:Uncharacterized protein n=1 Tax=Streptomyces venezuelae TaxID=54571 RepID=A0A5P2CS15_STRVZ|nr:hypothetical protein DEJ49_33165 [Streptomyces venezuelae]